MLDSQIICSSSQSSFFRWEPCVSKSLTPAETSCRDKQRLLQIRTSLFLETSLLLSWAEIATDETSKELSVVSIQVCMGWYLAILQYNTLPDKKYTRSCILFLFQLSHSITHFPSLVMKCADHDTQQGAQGRQVLGSRTTGHPAQPGRSGKKQKSSKSSGLILPGADCKGLSKIEQALHLTWTKSILSQDRFAYWRVIFALIFSAHKSVSCSSAT